MKLNLTETNLFSGLYETIWLNTSSLENETNDWTINRKEYLTNIADVYINFLSNKFPQSKWKLDYVASPAFYNFDTDIIILEWINAPKNAKTQLNKFLTEIENNEGFSEFEYNTIYDEYCGSEILSEIYEKELNIKKDKKMRLKEINLNNGFLTIIKGDFNYVDYGYKEKNFFHTDFEKVMTFLTITQEIYNKADDLKKHVKNDHVGNALTQYIVEYFNKYTNYKILEINKYADTWIMDEMFEFLPFATSDDYNFPKHIEYIKIIKDGKVYLFEKNQSEEDIKKAQEYIIKYLQE